MVVLVVVASVAQIDPANEGDVTLGSSGMQDHEQLLMVTSGAPHPLVEQHLPAGGVDNLGEVAVLLLAETGGLRMRPPQQTLDVYPASCDLLEHVDDSGARPDEQFVGIAAQSVNSTTSPAVVCDSTSYNRR